VSRAGTPRPLHPLVRDAARGTLPEWAVLSPSRKAHVERVAALLESWAGALELGDDEALRWRGAGMLHDVLRDEDPERLLPLVPHDLRDMAPAALHAPAAAARLQGEGVDDDELLLAVALHPVGSREWGPLGRHLYLADFLEPGRSFRAGWRTGLRERVPAEADAVLREVVRARVEWALERGHPIHPETRAFRDSLTEGAHGQA
jgi:HD superfamily phosphohydrolase YqeK